MASTEALGSIVGRSTPSRARRCGRCRSRPAGTRTSPTGASCWAPAAASACVGPDGKWQASSLVLPLGQKLAWISMVLVTKDRRRGGVGTRPAEALHRRSAGRPARSPGLDATEQGRPIYLPLGFRDLYRDLALAFRRGDGCAVAPPPASPCGRSTLADLPRLALYDRPLSGMERPTILAHLAAAPARSSPGSPRTRRAKIAGFVAGPRGQDGDLASARWWPTARRSRWR